MHKRDFTGMGALDTAYHASFSVEQQRRDFQAQPPQLQRETMERVQRIVAAHPDNWLAKHWQEIYVTKGPTHDNSW